MTQEATTADVSAMLDVIGGVTERADSMDFTTAVEFMDALDEVKRKAAEAIDLIRMELLRQVESGPRSYEGRTFVAVNDVVTRFDNDEILRRAAIRSMMDDNGEILPAGVAVENLAKAVKDLYLAPSTKPKVTALDELIERRGDVSDTVVKGRKLKVLDEATGRTL
jgi:hypothetical protein